MALDEVKLKDGTTIPKNARISFASDAILNDPSVTPNPEVFDPFRSYRARQANGEVTKHLMIMTDTDHLHFGHGTQSCPGRFFAVNEMKMMLVRLLTEFDFRFSQGKGRPRNFFLDENVFPDPRGKLEMRVRGH